MATTDERGAEIASQRKPNSHLHASGVFSQETKTVWSSIVKLHILERERLSQVHICSVPDLLQLFNANLKV